jgi:hypothetical protein
MVMVQELQPCRRWRQSGGCDWVVTLLWFQKGCWSAMRCGGRGGVQHCFLGGWVMYPCVVDVELSSIVMVRQSVWAHSRSGWVVLRSVVRTGRWDNGENKFTLFAISWCWGVSGTCITCIDWVEVMERTNCGVTSLETAQGSWSVCLCGGCHADQPTPIAYVP